jgi:hypothetical protein
MKNNYKEQNGCHNCKRCFIFEEYDEDYKYFCTLNAPPRPKCGSTFMSSMRSEEKWSKDKETRYKERATWEEWQEGKEVKAWGICDEYAE